MNIKISEEFTAEKTNDVFKAVSFTYGNAKWDGAIPKYLERQGVEFSEIELKDEIKRFYNKLNPKNKKKWIKQSDNRWKDKKSQTYKVLKALYSGKWECRVHGPVPKVNPQPAARLGALKKAGYIIGSRRLQCPACNKKTMHDILIMLDFFEFRFSHGNELRAAMSDKLKERIKRVLGKKEACFGIKRTSKELIIDHKFPSQRWSKPEAANLDDMSEAEIKNKFQLLTNQTNMWKSRHCDTCVKTKKRGDFMGINWYYKGNKAWRPKKKSDEKGCIGCPWYDLETWKKKLYQSLSNHGNKH